MGTEDQARMKRSIDETESPALQAPARMLKPLQPVSINDINQRAPGVAPLGESNCSVLTCSMRSNPAAPDGKIQSWEVLYLFHRHMSGCGSSFNTLLEDGW